MATSTGQISVRTCAQHRGRPLELICAKCDKLICYKCLLFTHKGHNVSELSDIYPKKKRDIQNFIDTSEQNDLVQIRECIESSDTLLKNNTSNFETLSCGLKMQTEKLKKDLDSFTQQTLSLYHKMMEDNATMIQKYKQELQTFDRQLRQQIQECKAVLQHGSQIEIYDKGCEIHSQLSLPVKPVIGLATFTPNTNPQHPLKLALGKIAMLDQELALTNQDGSARAFVGPKPSYTSQQSTPIGKEAVVQDESFRTPGSPKPSSLSQQSEPAGNKTMTTHKLLPQTKVLEEWRAPPVSIRSMCPTVDGQVWTCGYSKKITLQDKKGKVIQEVMHTTNINDISLSPTTHTLWVCDTENNIMELESGKLTHRFSTKVEPKCICVTAANHVIVGMTNNISKFTTQGQKVLTSSGAGAGKPLVCSPWRISECHVTHNVAVADRNNKTDGGEGIRQVVGMDTDFKKLFVNRGEIHKQSSLKGTELFNPWGVVYDSVGNIIIGDCNNNRVLLISGRGKFLRIIHTDTYRTRAVGVDREDVLWAVFGGVNVKLLQYKNV